MLGDIRESFGELPEWADEHTEPEDQNEPEEQDEYLDRLGAVEDEGEDDTAFDRVLHPDVPIGGRPTITNRTGTRITNINADNLTVIEAQVGGEIHIRDNSGGFATISAREINHPVIERIVEENQRLRDRIEHIETQSTRLAEVVGDMLNIMKEDRK